MTDDDGMAAAEVVVLTAAFLLEKGEAAPPAPYVASIRRYDGGVVTMLVTNVDSLLTLLQQTVPQLDSPSFRLLRGRNEAHAQRDLVALLNARLRLH